MGDLDSFDQRVGFTNYMAFVLIFYSNIDSDSWLPSFLRALIYFYDILVWLLQEFHDWVKGLHLMSFGRFLCYDPRYSFEAGNSFLANN